MRPPNRASTPPPTGPGVDNELTTAMESGDLKTSLIALRRFLVDRIKVASTRDIAPISKELRDVVEAIQELEDNTVKGGRLESIREQQRKRLDRLATAAHLAPPNHSKN